MGISLGINRGMALNKAKTFPGVANTVAPAITGTFAEGQVLTCSAGTWNTTVSVSYQWTRGGENISGATSNTYTLVPADTDYSIGCTVVASNPRNSFTISATGASSFWVLGDAVVDVDLDNARFWWDGSFRALTDLTANGDGSYDLSYGSWFTGDATIITEVEMPPDSQTATGTIASWHVGTSERVEVSLTNSAPLTTPRLYVFPSGAFHTAIGLPNDEAGSGYETGLRRFITTVKSGTAPKLQRDDWVPATSATAAGTLTAPTKLTFGRNARFGNDRLTNATVRRVTIFNRILSDAEFEFYGRRSKSFPIYLLGGSFLNLYRIYGNLLRRTIPYGYVPLVQDGKGGSSLQEQLTRFTPDTRTVSSVDYDVSKYKDSTLVFCDFGLIDTEADAISAIDGAVALLSHDRWFYLEPAPNDDAGTANRIAMDAKVAAIRAHIGEDRFVSTLDKAQALSNGSADDVAELAKDKWPLSIKTSAADFHPNEAGYAAISGWIFDKLLAEGWIAETP